MKEFTGPGQRVKISDELSVLNGRTGTVTLVRKLDGGAWIDIDGGLPDGLRRFPKGDSGGRENWIVFCPDQCILVKKPIFILDADDGTAPRAIGMACDRPTAVANLTAEIQGALDRLEEGRDGDVIYLKLSRCDMTDKELGDMPEE